MARGDEYTKFSRKDSKTAARQQDATWEVLYEVSISTTCKNKGHSGASQSSKR